jgi:hypothetical protein
MNNVSTTCLSSSFIFMFQAVVSLICRLRRCLSIPITFNVHIVDVITHRMLLNVTYRNVLTFKQSRSHHRASIVQDRRCVWRRLVACGRLASVQAVDRAASVIRQRILRLRIVRYATFVTRCHNEQQHR